MERGIKKAKSPKQVRQEKRASKGLASAVAQIVGIGLVAGAALVVGTDRVMKKIFKDQDHQDAKDAQKVQGFDRMDDQAAELADDQTVDRIADQAADLTADRADDLADDAPEH